MNLLIKLAAIVSLMFGGTAHAFHFLDGYFVPNKDLPEERIHLHTYKIHPVKPSKDAIIFIQGRNEFVGMYKNVASSFLGTYNSDVYMYDLRGQGDSSGTRCHIDSYDQYLGDLDALITELKSRHRYKNIHLTAHSTGGLISALYVAKNPGALGPNGTVVLGSPFLAMNKPYPLELAIRAISKFLSLSYWTSTFAAKSNECLPFEQNDLTGHKGFYDQFSNHPKKCGPPTWGWLQASQQAQSELMGLKNQINVPMLILTAGEDSVVKSEVSRKFCQDLNAANPGICEIEDYPGMKHLLYHETDRKKVLKRIANFRKPYMN